MSDSRTITVYSTQGRGESQTIDSDVQTWGELKALIEFGTSNVRAVVRENRTTLEANEAILPETAFTVFLYPEKVKSGTDGYDEMTLAELRRIVKSRKSMSTKSDKPGVLRKKLRDYDKRAERNGIVPAKSKAKASPKKPLEFSKLKEAVIPDVPCSSHNPVETQNAAIRSVIEDLKKGFDKAFDDTLRGIEDEGVTKVALQNDADQIAKELGINSDKY